MTDRKLIWRLSLVVGVTCLAWCGLGVRLAALHLGSNERLKERVRRIRHYEKQILVGRGLIYDAENMCLAGTLKTKDIIVDPKRILDQGRMQAVASALTRVLDLKPGHAMKKINRPTRRFEYLERYVHADEFERLARMNLPGVIMRDSTARYYPHESMLCHVIGFSNLEGNGCAGVELKMDRYLRGQPGQRISQRDGRGREIYSQRLLGVEPRKGCNVYLTINMNVQYLVEKALLAAVNEHNAKGAWAVVQEVKTGRILAMASLPQYDPNIYRKSHEDEMLNRVIGYTYEPGSTMKAAVFAAAFNEGVISEHTVFNCEYGTWYYRGRPLRDYHPYGNLSAADVLKKSSNIGTAKIALLLGPARLERYLRDFGMGRRCGIDLPGEEAGILWPHRKWDSLMITRIPIGHSIAVTSLQMVCMYSAIANDGYLMKPLLVDRVVNDQGERVYQGESEVVARPIGLETSRMMRRLLGRVTEDGGTARRARVDGYDVAGKTGTSEKIIDGRYARHANIASFAGFLPAGNPEIAILVVVDEPHKFHTGGRVAAPVFQEIAAQLVQCLTIPPEGRDSVVFSEGEQLTRSDAETPIFEVQ
jgi:cell division protein FtsI (penicillin-binding protein 3)